MMQGLKFPSMPYTEGLNLRLNNPNGKEKKTMLETQDRYEKLKTRLLALDRVTSAESLTMTFEYKGKIESFVACKYTEELEYTKDMMACTHNGITPGTKYTREGIHILANTLPKSYAATKQKCLYRFDDDTTDWYVACWHLPVTTGYEWACPDGAFFILCPWNITPAIDAHENKPRQRFLVHAAKAGI